MANAERLDSEIVYDRDFDYDYFGFKVQGRPAAPPLALICYTSASAVLLSPMPCRTLAPQTLERSYLLRVNGKVVERPQHMLMRVSVGIHGRDIDAGVCVCGVVCVWGGP